MIRIIILILLLVFLQTIGFAENDNATIGLNEFVRDLDDGNVTVGLKEFVKDLDNSNVVDEVNRFVSEENKSNGTIELSNSEGIEKITVGSSRFVRGPDNNWIREAPIKPNLELELKVVDGETEGNKIVLKIKNISSNDQNVNFGDFTFQVVESKTKKVIYNKNPWAQRFANTNTEKENICVVKQGGYIVKNINLDDFLYIEKAIKVSLTITYNLPLGYGLNSNAVELNTLNR